jgi:hypothetical protein
MSFFHLHSHRVQLVVTGLTAALVTAGALTAYDRYSKRVKRNRLKEDVVRSLEASALSDPGQLPSLSASAQEALEGSATTLGSSRSLSYDENLVREQLARNHAFFGDEAMAKVRKGSVVIVGCGGVGSW